MAYPGKLTCAQMVAEVSRNLGLGGSPGTTGAAIIETHLNWAQELIAMYHPFKCLERYDSSLILQDGVVSYHLPPQICRLLGAKLINDTCFVLEDCESGWADAAAKITTTHDSDYVREGLSSVKLVLEASSSTQIAYSADMSTVRDISDITAGAVGLWVYTTVATSSGDFQLILTETTAGAESGQYVTLDLPALSAYTWNYCKITEDSSGDALDFSSDGTLIDALLSIGIKSSTDAAMTLYVDGINLYDTTYSGSDYPLAILYSTEMDTYSPNPERYAEVRPVALTVSGAKDSHHGNAFDLSHVPDDNYPLWLRYIKWPEPFDYTNNANGVSDLVNLDHALVAAATISGFYQERAWHSGNQWEAKLGRMLSKARDRDIDSDGWRPVMHGHSLYGDEGIKFDVIDIPTTSQGGARGSTSGYFYI